MLVNKCSKIPNTMIKMRKTTKTSLFLLLFFSVQFCVSAQEQLLRSDLTANSATFSSSSSNNGSTASSPSASSTASSSDSSSASVASKLGTGAVVTLDDNSHICVREETYVEQLKVPTMQPVRVRSSQWCLEFPPRCSNYKTEMREFIQIKNVTKTRTIRFCCAGYEGNISINDTVCKPVCRGGCGRGFCQTPDVCSCEAGYTGTHCTQRCDHDHWGDECKQQCKCRNGAVCDNKSGICHCTTGWTGQFCELPCPAGSYGVMCHKECACADNRCHPQTGACADANNVLVVPNATHVIIQTLNSTIANITHKLDRIANKIVTIATSTLLPPSQLTAAPEVIVIKQQEDQPTPKIIVHQTGAAGANGKQPEVIHVITGPAGSGVDWSTHPNGSIVGATNEATLNFAGVGGGGGGVGLDTAANSVPPAPTAAEHDANMLSTILIMLLIIIIAIGFSWLYVYRRYHWQKQRAEAALTARHAGFGAQPGADLGGVGGVVDATAMAGVGGGGKSFLKPLPDLPAFTQMVRNKIEAHAFYDAPSRNTSPNTTTAYDYARKHSVYSIITPKPRKGSPESHLYDEIPYPPAFQHHNQQQQHMSHNTQKKEQEQQVQQQQHVHPQNHQQSHLHGFEQQHQQIHNSHAFVHTQQLSQPLQHSQLSNYISQQQHQLPQQQPKQQQQQPKQHHITHLIIPPQNTNYLQVPSTNPTTTNVNAATSVTRKVALI